LRRGILAVVLVTLLASSLAGSASASAPQLKVRVLKIHYRAHNGKRRTAYLALPSTYRPRTAQPLPLVIAPHGRGISGRANLRLWGRLPARGGFAVISPDGEGRELGAYSWGAPGQIEDLARMPQIVKATLPWVKLDWHRIYAFGGSMGGQETLLLVARHPHLLAGAAVFDAVADFPLQYYDLRHLRCNKRCLETSGNIGQWLQRLVRKEVGGSPTKAPQRWRLRNPINYVGAIARSRVPLQIWWSTKDEIVSDQQRQSKRLIDLIRRLNPKAPVDSFRGYWRHSAEMKAARRLPLALAEFGLVPGNYSALARQMHVVAAPGSPAVELMPPPPKPPFVWQYLAAADARR
jgi:pimeloyl-ACP methyl ester carboxylesterase